MFRYANPAMFMRLSGALLPWVSLLALVASSGCNNDPFGTSPAPPVVVTPNVPTTPAQTHPDHPTTSAEKSAGDLAKDLKPPVIVKPNVPGGSDAKGEKPK